jgi:hypothetical protein
MKIRSCVTVGVLLAAVGVVGWAVTRPPAAEPAAAPHLHTTTAPVVRGDVTARVQLAGVLGFNGTYAIVNQLPGGVVTTVPAQLSIFLSRSLLGSSNNTSDHHAVIWHSTRDAQPGSRDGLLLLRPARMNFRHPHIDGMRLTPGGRVSSPIRMPTELDVNVKPSTAPAF